MFFVPSLYIHNMNFYVHLSCQSTYMALYLIFTFFDKFAECVKIVRNCTSLYETGTIS
jgi:hypothetical protein